MSLVVSKYELDNRNTTNQRNAMQGVKIIIFVSFELKKKLNDIFFIRRDSINSKSWQYTGNNSQR